MYLRYNRRLLLKKAIAPLAMMASKAIIHIGPHGLSLKASEPDSNIMVVLRIDFSNFDGFSWDVDKYGEISLVDLDSIMDCEGPVSISTDEHNSRLLEFTFDSYKEYHIHPHYGQVHRSLGLNEVCDKSQIIDDLKYEPKAFVGIPSTELERILTHFYFYGKLVHVTITNNQLKFSTANQEMVLAKENGKCTIAGVDENDRFQFTIGLKHMAAFFDALVLSRKVWIITPAQSESPFMLDCPVEEVGHIKFFYPP